MPVTHTVDQGECISSIAFDYGFFPDTIWNDPANATLKRKRKDPNVLEPGDTVIVPDKRIAQVPKPTDAIHKFRRKGVPKKIRIVFMGADSKPLRNRPYTFEVDGKFVKGTTDGDGAFEHAIVPNAQKARVLFDDGTSFTLNLGFLDPLETTSGVKGRLQALGYYKGEVDEEPNDELTDAIRLFQASQDLEPSGVLDAPGKELLRTLVGD
jgi:hypothetical protein